MKILTVTEGYPPDTGGGSTYAYEIPKRLSKYNVETTVITGKTKQSHTDTVDKRVSVLRLDIPEYKKAGFSFNLNRFRFVFGAIKKCVEYKDDYDIYHFHSGMASKLTSWILRNLYGIEKPFVMTFLGTFVGDYGKIYPFPISGILNFFSKRLMVDSRCDRYIVVDDGTHAERVLLSEGVPRGRIRKHYQTVDLDKFKPKQRKTKKEKIIGYIGRMDPMKGIEVFIRSLPEVLEREKNTRVLMVGDGPLLADLKNLTNDLGIAHRVEFIGTIDHSDIPAYMNLLDCIVFTDIRSFENKDLLSLTHCEAMACGSLILNSAKPRKEWKLKTWVQIEKPEPGEISKKLLDISQNPKKYEYMRRNARKVAEKYFGWENVIDLYYEEFKTLIRD